MHVVGIIGGAVAGSEAAALVAESGALAIVFEQGDRPYGKIEDGLPRWHEKLRSKEFQRIDANLSHPNVRYIPRTRVGKDVELAALRELGFSALVLANGAWRDRRLPVDGVDAYVGKGFAYQNDFVYWFNHHHEAGYAGPAYECPEGALVVGGGLASVDVAKILSLETHARKLREQGVEVDVVELELKGIPAWCKAKGIELPEVIPPTLVYRRDMESMPLASFPAGADDARKAKVRASRVKIMKRVMDRYCVAFQPLRTPVGLLVEDDALVGLKLQHTELADGRVRAVEGAVDDVRAPLVVSSIGSVPAPMGGVPMRGDLYDFEDEETGALRDVDGVFGLGNVLTGRGNIKESRLNAQVIARGLLSARLLAEADEGASAEAFDQARADIREAAARQLESTLARQAPDAATREGIERFVQERWDTVGYPGDYMTWAERHRPES
ncbi:MAG: FAD-dependent oxidoreductase [Myxococcota bacterium]